MSRGPFEPEFEELPPQIPLFPLASAVLLPGGHLPLDIFEAQYLAMIRDCLKTPHRLIGMIQSKNKKAEADLYEVGCAGRISSFAEGDDGRVEITLSGVIRYRTQDIVQKEKDEHYMIGQVDWLEFARDLKPDQSAIDRGQLIQLLKTYFRTKGYKADWENIEECGDERLVNIISMVCPFGISEKQALLESPDLSRRAELLMTILQMASHADGEDTDVKH